MNDRRIDEILKQTGQSPNPVDPAVLDRVTGAMGSSLQPVRPLPPRAVLEGGLVLLCAALALAGAIHSGFNGFEKQSVLDRALIFPALGLFLWLAASSFVSEMIPGSKRRVAPAVLLAGGSAAMILIFVILFRDYVTHDFIHQGLVCLATGLLYATPAALGSWWLLRRGFAVNPVSAGLVAGTLGGLAGVTMLELHCPNFETLHLVLWHTAVILVSGAVGALLGRGKRGSNYPRPLK